MSELFTVIVNGSDKALLSRADVANFLGSPDLAKRAASAARRGIPGWLLIARDGRDVLYTAASVRAVARRIAAGELPPAFKAASVESKPQREERYEN